ncbi:MAG: polysaccharide biosynthesis tyrosine autokinase [Candidatus Sulfotelmatobacter sp.]
MAENELTHRQEMARLATGSLSAQPSRIEPRSYSVLDGDVSVDAFGQLRATWDILVKHQWVILATAAILTALVAVYSFKVKPVYQATGRLDIEAELPLLQSLNELFRTGEADDSFLATEVSILQSDNLIWETIQQLGLGATEKTAATMTPATKNALIAEFRGRLKVERTKDTHMVTVSYESTDPRETSLVVNSLIKNFVENNFQTKYNATRQATGWMEGQLDELKVKVEKAQQAMVNYERANNIANLGEKQTVAESRFEDLSKEFNQAQSDRLTKESLYKMVATNDAQVGFLAANNGPLASLEAKELDLKEQYSEALAQYGPTYPKALRLQDQMKDVDALIVRERKRMVENIRNEFLAAARRQQFLAAALADQKKEVDKGSQFLIEYNLLKRELDSNQTLYDGLLQRLKDATVTAGLRATNIHTIDEAAIPTYPVRPNKLRNIEFALAAGLALGIALAFTQEALDNSIKNAQEMEKLTGLPTLAIIPMGTSSLVLRSGFLSGNGNGHSLPTAVELAVLQKPGAAISEAYRALRTSVLLSMAEQPPKVLLVTSSQPGEGKTSTSLNLAATLAQKGSRVLLVDADMRRPGLSKALNTATGSGLSGILTGAYEYDETLLKRVPGLDTLYLLSSGPRAPNPAELLCSIKMEKLVQILRQKFDHVIIDSPPILPITDATIISTLVDGVIMVVESDKTSRAALNRACRVMEHSGGRILGSVFNKVDTRRDGYYGYRYYHGYYTRSASYYYEKNDEDSTTS